MQRIMNEVDIKLGIKTILQKIEEASLRRPQELQYVKPTLVAVSKTKPVDMIIDAYEAGQRHFGENYVQELVDKANNPKLLDVCKDIRWHFIGRLQSNKVNKIINLQNLHMIETVNSEKLADALNKRWEKANEQKLNVMIQINTSDEDEKNGINPTEATSLTKHIMENCPNLHLDGIMTIGKFGYDPVNGPNPDFLTLRQCRDSICTQLGLDWKKFNLSMGMSSDFEHAIELGSTNVRVGSSIFGFRAKKE